MSRQRAQGVFGHPPLGLMLAIGGLQSLTASLGLLAVFITYDVRWSSEAAVLFGPLAVTLLQITTGITIMWRRYARIACAGYAIAIVAAIVLVFVSMPELDGRRQQIAMAIEMIGPPLVVFVVPWLFGMRDLTTGPANAAGGVLIALAFTSFLSVPVTLVENVRLIDTAQVSTVLGMSISPLVSVVISTCALIAGLRLVTGRPARTAMLVYMIVAIVARVALEAFTMIYISITMESRILDRVLAQRAPFLISAVAIPVLLWAYVKPELEQRSTARGDLTLVWAALWLVPILIARCVVLPDLDEVVGLAPALAAVLGCALLAILYALAGVLAVRRETRGRLLWLGAALVAALLFALAIFATWSIDRMFDHESRLIVHLVPMLIVIPATIAWLRQRPRNASLDDVFD